MTVHLTATRARRLRAHSQLIRGSELSPTRVVERAVALQGQNLGAVLRAIALRSAPGTTVADVRAAFDRGELVRSWPMRGTLFATTPQHLATLLAFTGERIHRATTTRRGQLGLEDATIERAWEVLGSALAERPRTREEVLALWSAAGIPTDSGRGYHLLMHLSVAGRVHWGAFETGGSSQLLTLSTTPPPEDPDAALVQVVRGYVLARGPVTEADLAWWTKLPKTVLRRALARVEDLVEVQVEGAPALVVAGDPGSGPEQTGVDERGDLLLGHPSSGVRLLPAFDEWILGYADRSLVASPGMLRTLEPGSNGVFRPIVLVDGRVVGTWKVQAGRRGAPARAGVDLFEDVPDRTQRAIDRAAGACDLD